MNAHSAGTGKSDKIGELWAELQKTEERLRTVGGGISSPTMDCFVNDLPKDPFDATVFTALSDADIKSRIGAAQPAVAAMVASVVADLDGKTGGQLSPLFARGGAQLAPMAVVEGPHSQWTSGLQAQPAQKPAGAGKLSSRDHLAQTALDAKKASAQRKGRIESSTEALSAGFDTPSAHFVPPAPKTVPGKMMSSSDALHSAIAPAPEPLKAEPEVGPQLFDPKVPEPRAHRDMPSSVRAMTSAKIKPIEKKQSLWVRLLWG